MKTKQAKAPRAAKPKEYIVIDHPRNGESLTSAHYAVRIGASSAPVEISIDGSAWSPCRHAAGYYWFDWTGIPSGPHKLTARIKTAKGLPKASKAVQCAMK